MWKVYRHLQTLNKKALIASKFAKGSILGTFSIGTTFRKTEKSLDRGELAFHAKKTASCRLQQQTKVHVLALAQQTTL